MSIIRNVLLLSAIFVSVKGFSVVYTPGHTKVLFTEIDGWVRGRVQDISYKKVEQEDKVYTVVSLSVDEYSGISRSQITNINNFKVHYPGGRWQGVYIKYSGSSDFSVGDRGVFLLKKKIGGFYIHGLSAGIIPESAIGLISDLTAFSEKRFGEIQQVSSGALGAKNNNYRPRLPASNFSELNNSHEGTNGNEGTDTVIFSFFAILILLFFLVGRSGRYKK